MLWKKWISKIFISFLIVWCFFLSLSLFFSPESVFPSSWRGSNHFTGLQSFSASMNITCDWIKKKKTLLEPSPHKSHSSMALPCLFVYPTTTTTSTNNPSPPSKLVSLLPGLWKANEESWAEGSFCVLVKKNNLCQRRVLQQLCCRTCSQKGWQDVVAGH